MKELVYQTLGASAVSYFFLFSSGAISSALGQNVSFFPAIIALYPWPNLITIKWGVIVMLLTRLPNIQRKGQGLVIFKTIDQFRAGSFNHFNGAPNRGEPTFHQWKHSILRNAALWLAEIRRTPIWRTIKMI